eukprot:scaffold7342_cov269-Pinguiococcus_pyrenoidosus.AAC.9
MRITSDAPTLPYRDIVLLPEPTTHNDLRFSSRASHTRRLRQKRGFHVQKPKFAAVVVVLLPDLRSAVAQRWIASKIEAQRLQRLVDHGDRAVQSIVSEALVDTQFANGDAEAQAFVVLDRVPLPVRVVQQVSSFDVCVSQGQVRRHRVEIATNGLEVHSAALDTGHVGRPARIHEVPALAPDDHGEVVVAESAVPAGARGFLGVLLAIAHHQLAAEEGAVGLGAEAGEDAVQLQIVPDDAVDVPLEVFGGEVAHGELLAGLDREEQVLGRPVHHDVAEGLSERHRRAAALVVVVRGILHDRHGVFAEDRREVVRAPPLLHRNGALEKPLDDRRVAPVVRRGLQSVDRELRSVDVGHLDGRILGIPRELQVPLGRRRRKQRTSSLDLRSRDRRRAHADGAIRPSRRSRS